MTDAPFARPPSLSLPAGSPADKTARRATAWRGLTARVLAHGGIEAAVTVGGCVAAALAGSCVADYFALGMSGV